MTNQTELLAALDRALGALWANGVLNDFLDREAINTLTALREQIAKGPAAWCVDPDYKTLDYHFPDECISTDKTAVHTSPLYTLTGADQ